MNPELDRAYRSTRYRVMIPGEGPLDLRIGVRSVRLAAWLSEHGSEGWAFVTAWNPGSRPCAPEENRSRHAELIETIVAAGWRYYPGAGIPDRAGWAPEDSLLVLDISREEARALGRQFGQAAIVVGGKAAVPELAYLSATGE